MSRPECRRALPVMHDAQTGSTKNGLNLTILNRSREPGLTTSAHLRKGIGECLALAAQGISKVSSQGLAEGSRGWSSCQP